MLKLAESVNTLVADITKSPPSTPSRHSRTTLDASPVCPDCAFCTIAEREALSPHRLAHARTIFRGHTELADEYLSFHNDEVEARREWLNIELSAIAIHLNVQ
jgi:hypothetical protein